jgi:hypothetical protein
MRSSFLFSLAVAASILAATPATARMIVLSATLDGKQQVPPVDTRGRGSAEISYDTGTRQLDWTVTYNGLSGPAIAAHFHGPAGPGENAPPVVPFRPPLASPISGSATLTEEQAKELLGGKLYINIHTAAHKSGEIRGQVTKAPL